jgi:spore coat protein U-like protein
MKKHNVSAFAKFFLFAAASAFGLFSSNQAQAGSASANLSVSASVSDSCTISTSPLAFGAYDPSSGSPLDGSGSLTVQCTLNASASIQLGQGSNADAGSTDAAPLRRLADGSGNFLSYALDQDAAHTTIWGNTGGTGMAHTGTGASANISVYGRISASQNVPAGAYSDTVQATINF